MTVIIYSIKINIVTVKNSCSDYIQHSDKNSYVASDKNSLLYTQHSDKNSYVAVIIYSINNR